ncbi:hypothetical protein HII31_02862, partial [Pseudocercospora fuligena]
CGNKKQKTRSGLQHLPVELIEQICDEKRSFNLYHLFGLRLACRELNHKSLNIFAKSAFERLVLHLDSVSLQRFKSISQQPALASKVEWLLFSDYDRHGFNSLEDYEKARQDATSREIPRKARRKAIEALRKAHIEQDDKDYIERSGTDSIALALALQRMPNLRTFNIMPYDLREDRISIRRRQTGTSPTTSRNFSVLAAALEHAERKIHELNVWWVGHHGKDEGISVQALVMPWSTLQCFSQLRSLDLWLQTRDNLYRSEWQRNQHRSSCEGSRRVADIETDPRHWQRGVANLLMTTTQLRRLRLGFRNHWEDTESVFEHIAKRVVLPHLESLTFDYLRCSGESLKTIIGTHTGLQTLDLDSMDITGNVPFSATLDLLAEKHKSLTSFDCGQISQNSYRLYFRTLGKIEQQDSVFRNMGRFSDDANNGPDDFLNDLVVVDVFKYHGSAGEWEGVQDKIAKLRDDIRVSNKHYTPEYDFGGYQWTREP